MTKKVCDDFRILANLAPVKWPHAESTLPTPTPSQLSGHMRKARYPLQPLASTTGSCTRFQLKK